MKTYEQKFIVELADVTPNFGLKPTTIFKYYQETFARYCAKYNVAGYDVYQMGLKWVFGQSVVQFLDIMPIWNEEVTAKVYVSNIKKLRIYIDFEIFNKRGLIAKGQSVAYILDLKTSRPQSVDKITEHFVLDEDNLNGEIVKFDFAEDKNLIAENEHTINFSDIDYNNHTNNISYIALAFEGMPTTYIQNKYPSTVSIKYLQETFVNDVLKCEIYQNEDCFKYKIINSNDNSDVCIIDAHWNNKNLKPNDFFKILENVRKTY